jgi:hypothetical protein
MRNIQQLIVALFIMTLAACGGGGTLDSDGGTGGGNTTPVYSVSVALTDASGNASTALAQATPLTATVTLTATNGGAVANQLITFTINDVALATFSNAAGTALTNGDGVATITLAAGSKSGAGNLTATYSGTSATTGFTSAGDGGDSVDVVVGNVILLADKLQLGTGSNDKVVLSALVRDPNNNLLVDVPVTFSSVGANNSDGGELVVLSASTEADGVAKAELKSAVDANIRSIVVTAAVGQVSASLTVNVVGTEIDVSAPDSAVIGSTVQISAILRNSENQAIANTALSVMSELGNTFSTTTPVTNATGQATFSYTATNSGADVITVSAMGTSTTVIIDISSDEFSLDTAAGVEVNLNTNFAVKLTWLSDGLPQANQTVSFDSSRGGVFTDPLNPTTASSVEAVTNANGEATVYLRSSSAGVSTISARAGSGDSAVSTQSSVEFIATTPNTVVVQASPSQLGIGEQSTIRAVVRDANNNPVKNSNVSFSLSGTAGGSISPASARTNSQGIASTVFTATATSARDGGVVSAATSGITSSTTLTVGERTMFFRIATGNTLQIPTESTYSKQFSVIVTDASGNPVQNQTVFVSATPTLGTNPTTDATWAYAKGFYTEFPDEPNFEYYVAVRTAECANEDANLNGILDAGEDYNGNGQLTPGNVVSVPQSIISDNNGVAVFNVTYGQSFASWIQVDLVVSDRADGTENRTSLRYKLPVSSTHVRTKGSPPPLNPFGAGANCADTL